MLHEKFIPCKCCHINLADKPDWSHEIVSLGKVPLLQVGDAMTFESAIICKYCTVLASEGPCSYCTAEVCDRHWHDIDVICKPCQAHIKALERHKQKKDQEEKKDKKRVATHVSGL